MRTRGLIIHISCPDRSIFEADIHVLLHFRYRVHLDLGEVLDKNALVRALFKLHAALDILAEQVVYLLVVYFDETAPDKMCLGGIVLRDSYYLAESPRNDASRLLGLVASHHGVCFSAASLAISENCAIVAV